MDEGGAGRRQGLVAQSKSLDANAPSLMSRVSRLIPVRLENAKLLTLLSSASRSTQIIMERHSVPRQKIVRLSVSSGRKSPA